MRTADGPTPSDMNSRSASPPRTTKIGVPHAAATSTKATSGQSAPADNVAGLQTSHAPTMSPHAATALAAHVDPELRTVRIAISPKASGSTVCAIHVVTPAAMTVPASRSLIISSYAPAQSIADTAAATVAASIPAMSRTRPAGRNVPVASASIVPSRAASAAPRKPTHNTRCWTNGMDPGMPRPNTRRSTISESGMTTITASAMPAIASSRG